MRTPIALIGLAAGVLIQLAAASATAAEADPTFLGKLALLGDPQMAKDLGLTDDIKSQITALIDKRMKEVQETVLSLPKNISAADKQAKLAPFVAESEKLGLALLTDEQQAKFEKLRIVRAGMIGLGEPEMADKLQLTDKQKQDIGKAIASFKQTLATGSEIQKKSARPIFEKMIAAQLTDEQKAAYEKIAGVPAGGVPAPAAGSAAKAVAGGASGAPREAASEVIVGPDGKFTINFSFAPWKDVIEFFAKQADLSLVTDFYPEGTFNYTDRRSYTLPQALDIVNQVLAVKGYQLVKSGRMLMLFNVADGQIPPVFVETVEPKELEDKGNFEFLAIQFQLSRMTQQDVELNVRPILGVQGSLTLLPGARQLIVADVVRNLRRVVRAVDAIEIPGANNGTVVIPLKHLMPAEFLPMVRSLIGMPEGKNEMLDGSLRIVSDELGGRIICSGSPSMIERVRDIVKLIDVKEERATSNGGPTVNDQAYFDVYPVTHADPSLVHQVVGTLLAGTPDARVSLDPKTGSLAVLARPAVHKTILAIINQMQTKGNVFEVIKLRKLDPQQAAQQITTLFGGVDSSAAPSSSRGAPVAPSAGTLRVLADPASLQLTINGTASQVEQVKAWLFKMGEVNAGSGGLAQGAGGGEETRQRFRMIPLGGRNGEAALEQAARIFSAQHGNKIRVINPEADKATEDAQATEEVDPRAPMSKGRGGTPGPAGPPRRPALEGKGKAPPRVPSDVTYASGTKTYFVSEPKTAQEPSAPAPAAAPPAAEAPADPNAKEPAEIVIQVTPAGVIVSSADLNALDEFENLLRSISPNPNSKEFRTFELRFVKADIATVLLQEMLSGGANLSSVGGTDLMSGIAASMFGGNPLANMFFGGGADQGAAPAGGSVTTTTGTAVTITPDPRRNVLYIQANYRDMETIERLLQYIDQEAINPVQTQSAPRFIPIIHGKVDEVATVVRQIYVGRIATDTGGGQRGGGGSPQEQFLQLLAGGGGRGGRGGGGGNNRNQVNRGEEPKMTLGVDTKSNSLIVSAPEYLFNEVKQLVEMLDVAAVVPTETVVARGIKTTSPLIMTSQLKSMLGAQATVTYSGASATTTTGRGAAGTNQLAGANNQNRNPAAQAAQQQLQNGRGGGNNNGGFPGGGGNGGFPGGGNNFGGGGGFPGGGGFGIGGFPGGGGGFGGGFPGGGGGRGGGGFPGGGGGGNRGGGGGGNPGGGGGRGGGGRGGGT